MNATGLPAGAIRRIGIDFDNTIISYDEVFLAEARRRELIGTAFAGNKKAVRDAIRLIPDGETEWMRLQGYVYGQGIAGAVMQPGLADFLLLCKARGIPVSVISHKTEYGHYDPARVNLREAALAWMEANGFFSDDRFAIRRQDVSFSATRREKLAEIGSRGCSHFIDDLEEVLSDPAFPPGVERILFAPEQPPGHDLPYPVCATWQEIAELLFPGAGTSPASIAARLLGVPKVEVTQVGGGRNSRVFRVDAGGRTWALKQYPHSAQDTRDRLGTEKAALALMAAGGFRNVPRHLGEDAAAHTALLEWIDGKLVTGGVTAADIDAAAAFLSALHRAAHESSFPEERLASEACLSGAEIERQIRARLSRLAAVPDQKLTAFLEETLGPALEQALAEARSEMKAAGLDFAAILPQKKRSLVPSDFGFHNSLRRPDGTLAFIDFEYFGWDDPAKLVADVLLHPGTPVGAEERLRFRRAAESIYGNDTTFAARLSAVLPLFAIRWALILLNEFIPERWQQRVAAGERKTWAEAKATQLDRAAKLLADSRVLARSVGHA